MPLIREAGELVAVVGRTRAYVLPHIARLPAEDGRRLRALAKCLYALGIASGTPRRSPAASARASRGTNSGLAGGEWSRRVGGCVLRAPV